MTSALSLLSAYESDDNTENNMDLPDLPENKTNKRNLEDEQISNSSKFIKSERLPLPSIFKPANLGQDQDCNLHNGRIRSFPHERGNWSTYVYIAYENNTVMKNFISNIIEKCNSCLLLQPAEDLHVSLTKTVILCFHWIDTFVKTVTKNVEYMGWFLILFDELHVYCNEERTRTFLGLKIKTGYDGLLRIIKALDKCLQEFNLPVFYKNPSFHMSIAWAVGDHEEKLKSQLEDLNKFTLEYISSHPQYYWYIQVKKLICKTGNKKFYFDLNPTMYSH